MQLYNIYHISREEKETRVRWVGGGGSGGEEATKPRVNNTLELVFIYKLDLET